MPLRRPTASPSRVMLVRQSTTVPKTSNVIARTPRMRSLSSCRTGSAANASVRANAAATNPAEPLARNSRRLMSRSLIDIEDPPAVP